MSSVSIPKFSTALISGSIVIFTCTVQSKPLLGLTLYQHSSHGCTWLTARSPEMLAPARIPVAAGKKMANTEKNVSPRKSGPMFSHIIEADRKKIKGQLWHSSVKANMSPQIYEAVLMRCFLYYFFFKQTNNKRPTIIAQESLSFLWLHRNEASNEVVEDGCDKDDE